MTQTLHHVGLSVADLDAAVAWYGRALGFDVEFPFELPGLRGAMLEAEGGVRLELFEREGSAPGLTGALPDDALLTRGYGHVALLVDDLEAMYARLVDAGAAAVWDPRPSPEPGVRMAFVHDPEGNLIELLEREENEMAYVVTAKWTAKDGEEERVHDCIKRLIEPSRAEPGNRFYQPNRDPENPRVFFFYEIYDDEDAYKAHGESEHFQSIGFGEAIPLLENRERVFYETIEG